jgi:hypothetical protein
VTASLVFVEHKELSCRSSSFWTVAHVARRLP